MYYQSVGRATRILNPRVGFSSIYGFYGIPAIRPAGRPHHFHKGAADHTTAALERNKISYCYILTIPVVFTKSRESCPKLSHA